MTKFKIKVVDKGITEDLLRKGLTLDKKSIKVWLENKSLLQADDELLSFNELTPWIRTGGETYSTTFSFITNKATFTLIAKAIVTMNPGKSFLDWTRRRKILIDNNIPVASWVWTGEATIIETYYPNSYIETSNFKDLIQIAYSLDKLGFITLNFLDDLRCDKEGNPFYTDFGFDLGEPSGIQQYRAKKCLINNYPNKQKETEAFYGLNL